MTEKRVYFDYAASTPVAPEVLKAMQPYFSEKYGNPGSLHHFGQEAMGAVDKARETIAEAIGLPPAGGFREVIFTGSATEANNLALRGVVKQFKIIPRIIISVIEHESILETVKDLEKEGVEIIYLPVSREGFVDLKKLKESLNERTILVSVMYANNEIGTIQPISKISEIVRNFRNNLKFKIKNFKLPAVYPLLHTDAVQAFQYLDCNVNKLGVDLMTLSAHKIYGPKGIGALYISPISPISPIITGGGQEFGLRSGTENVPAIAGFAKAVELAVKNRGKEKKRITELKNYFWQELEKIYPSAEKNGGEPALPNILNIYFPEHSTQDLLIKFDMAGLAVSSGAACSTRSTKPSHVLRALGFSSERVKNSIRFSFGKFTTEAEVKEALKRIKKIL